MRSKWIYHQGVLILMSVSERMMMTLKSIEVDQARESFKLKEVKLALLVVVVKARSIDFCIDI